MTTKEKTKITKENLLGADEEYYHWPFEPCTPCLKPLLVHAGFFKPLHLNNDDSCVHSLLLSDGLLERADLLRFTSQHALSSMKEKLFAKGVSLDVGTERDEMVCLGLIWDKEERKERGGEEVETQRK